LTAKIVGLAQQQRPQVRVQWRAGLEVLQVLSEAHNSTWALYRENYLKTIGAAATACGIDGIEVDFEFTSGPGILAQLGIVTPQLKLAYSQLLADIKLGLGGDREISADLGVWGIAQTSFPLTVLPWVDAGMLNSGAIDFVNAMSYHWSADGNLRAWQKDAWLLHDVWGYERSRVNIGIGYFSMEMKHKWDPFHIVGEPTWKHLQMSNPMNCQNVSDDLNICKKDDGSRADVFVGKLQNQRIGELILRGGWRGAFPWAANYDANPRRTNDSLAFHLGRGLGLIDAHAATDAIV